MQNILFTPSINDFQEKENQLQCYDHIDQSKIAYAEAGTFQFFSLQISLSGGV